MDASSDLGESRSKGKCVIVEEDYVGLDKLAEGFNFVVKVMICRKWDATNSFSKYLGTEFIVSYAEAHPDSTDMERKKICSLMDCQKLSREACAHAAQNDRLPVQTVIQVLYHEQQRLHNTMNSKNSENVLSVYSTTTTSDQGRSVSAELESLRRENDELKIEVLKLKMKIREMERLNPVPAIGLGSPTPSNNSTNSYANKPPLPRKSFINSVSKKLGKLYPLIKSDAIAPPSGKGRNKPSKDRRHSVS